MKKVTAIIPTYNEEFHIKEAIESVLWADEIIVVDSFSKDKTQEIVKSFPQVKLLVHEYENSAAQKNWTIPQAENDWIFLLDADERPTKKLINEVKEILNSETEYSAFWIKRSNTFMGRELKHIWNSDAVIRLFRKSNSKYEDKNVHAEVISEGKIGRLKEKLQHDTYRGKGLDFHLKKGNRYTNWSAYDYAKKVKKVTAYHLILRPAMAFFKHYILKRGILDGKPGLIISSLTAWNIFIRFAKVWRIHQGENIPKD